MCEEAPLHKRHIADDEHIVPAHWKDGTMRMEVKRMALQYQNGEKRNDRRKHTSDAPVNVRMLLNYARLAG